jgi:hypothetical protein
MVCSAGEGVNVPPRLTIEDAGFLAQHPLPQSYLSIPRDERRSTGEVWTWRWYAKLEEGITFNEVVVWVEVEAVCELKGAATSAAYLSQMLIHLRKCVLSFAWGISPFHQSSSQKNRLSY